MTQCYCRTHCCTTVDFDHVLWCSVKSTFGMSVYSQVYFFPILFLWEWQISVWFLVLSDTVAVSLVTLIKAISYWSSPLVERRVTITSAVFSTRGFKTSPAPHHAFIPRRIWSGNIYFRRVMSIDYWVTWYISLNSDVLENSRGIQSRYYMGELSKLIRGKRSGRTFTNYPHLVCYVT
jgi:hypothetical protein